MKFSAESMMRQMEENGFVFSSTQQMSKGKYLSFDAEWNYKDMPHLHEIHELTEAVQGAIEDDYVASVLIQKVGPFTVPLTMFTCAISRFENFHFSSFGPYVVLIRTKWSTEINCTTVFTDYFLGSKRFLKWSHHYVHRLLAQNYRVLMAKDVPMRMRRGQLRSKNYGFVGDAIGYGFLDSMNLVKFGVVNPYDLAPCSWSSPIDAISQGTTLVGSSDSSGVRLVRQNDVLQVFPRICMHAGASLDLARIENSCVACPWHGKLIRPIITISLAEGARSCESKGIKIEIKDSIVFVTGAYEV